MYKLSDDDFEQMVEAAIGRIPAQFAGELENVCFAVQDEPESWQYEFADDPEYTCGTYEAGELLGLYDGVNMIDRASSYDAELPDMITVFKGPHERLCSSREEIEEEIEKTVLHEVGHYFGLDDERLYEMGY